VGKEIGMEFFRVAEALTAKLQLAASPIALAFVDEAPEGVPTLERQGPSACTFWRWAEEGVFYAPADSHLNCPIGAMVMGFDLPKGTQQQLMGLVEMMVGCGYIGADEPARIPPIKGQRAGILYGPLRDFPVPADVILLWLTPQQAMLYSEAAGACAWTESAPTGVLGRPACAVIPTARDRVEPSLSLGCTGLRTFTEISQDQLLAAVPGSKLEEFMNALDRTVAANETMQSFYEQHKAQFVG
jgi:uncharacterized protein (DUF169 family)